MYGTLEEIQSYDIWLSELKILSKEYEKFLKKFKKEEIVPKKVKGKKK